MSDSPPANPADGDQPTDQPATGEPAGDAPPEQPGEDGRYPAEVVERLRREAAERRTRARDAYQALAAANARAEAASARLLALSVERYAGALADPADLLTYVKAEDLLGDDGLPGPDRITAAANELLSRKPHLGNRRPAGDIDQGPRGTTPPEPFDFSAVLREAAG
jgi:hypothetical protein